MNKKGIALYGLLGALVTSSGFAGEMGPVLLTDPGKIYVAIFGGAGGSDKINISQFGTACFTEADGGPLAVDAFGATNRRSVGLVGGHIGYQWMEIPVNSWGVVPAVELEGYYLGKSNFNGHDLNNNTARLPEHDFLVTYPLSTGVFLTNAVLNFNLPSHSRFHPYVGGGIGGAVVSISHARARQIAPPEPGINHYNAKDGDKDATFAAQGKAGLKFDFSSHGSLFVEYRGLYLAQTNYSFGSTVYPGHAATSNWLVKLGSQFYNTGAVGIQFSV